METTQSIPRFLLVSIIPPRMSDEEILIDLEEVKSLIETFGGEVADLVTQRRELPDKRTYIGEGKYEVIKQSILTEKISIMVLNTIAKPGQLHNLKQRFYRYNSHLEVWDRVDLILHIFSKHANTAEAKLQIELASMRHMGPRIYGMGYVMSRQGGGIGTLGVGETNTELMKRHWQAEMKRVKDELAKLAADRQRQLERRRRMGLQTVSIVGYTNAGKSSLFNLLSGKKKLVENALFATLDSSVGKLYLPELHQEILLSDTIGFIQNLPTTLIDAFRSTLMESTHADLLLHVIDISDPHLHKKIAVVEKILHDLDADNKPKLYVFNKCDQAPAVELEKLQKQYQRFSPLFISVKQGQGVEQLIQGITSLLKLYLLSHKP